MDANTTTTKPTGSLTAEEFISRCEAEGIHYVRHKWSYGTNVYAPIRDEEIPAFRKWFCEDTRCIYAIRNASDLTDEEFVRRLGTVNEILYEGNSAYYAECVAHANEHGTPERHIFWWR